MRALHIFIAIAITCSAHRADASADAALAFWCDGKQPETLPRVPSVPRDELDAPAPNELTLLGSVGVRLVGMAILRSMVQAALDGGMASPGAIEQHAAAEQARADAYRRRIGELSPGILPGGSGRGTNGSQQVADTERENFSAAAKWLTTTNEKATAEMQAGVTAVRQLLKSGADPDMTMLEELCITPRDLLIRAHQEFPRDTALRTLIAQLPPEREPPNASTRAFRAKPSTRSIMEGNPAAKPEMAFSPAKIAEALQGPLRACKPQRKTLGICERAAAKPPVLRPARQRAIAAFDEGAAQRTPQWWTRLEQEFPGHRSRLRYRANGQCWQTDGKERLDCSQWYALAWSVGDDIAGTPYQTRAGAFALARNDKLPDGYHVLNRPPGLYVARSGALRLDSMVTELPTAFIWPDAARHDTVSLTADKGHAWLVDHMDALMRNIPSIVNMTLLPSFSCSRACQLTLSTEMVAAAADWKHHLRPLPTDALFAVTTPAGDFVDSNFATIASHMHDFVAAAAKRDPGVVEWTRQDYDGFVRRLETRSVLASNRVPFIGFTYVPRYDTVLRDVKLMRGGLHGDWMTYPINCAVHRAFHPERHNTNGSCTQYALPLRLAVGTANLPSGVVARTTGRQIVLAQNLCFVDGRNAVVDGWSAACAAGSRRIPLADVFRHELGHWLGVEHVDDPPAGDATDIMTPVLGGALRFTNRSRNEAHARLGQESAKPLRINEELRLW